ncbi:hypothetical protein AVEN_121349-1, partial [Araneus ventricosus]
EDDQSSETEEDLSGVDSKGRTTAANLNVTSEHHQSSEDFGHKRKHETTDVDSMKKPMVFFPVHNSNRAYISISPRHRVIKLNLVFPVPSLHP